MIEQDKNELGLTDEAREAADEVAEAGGFKERQDVYRLAIAAALLKNLAPTPEGISRRTYIHVGGVDRDGAIRTAIMQLRDDHDGRPYALAERLAEAGIEDLHKHFHAGRPVREYLQSVGLASTADEPFEGEPSVTT
jgi:hypothetical protein